MVEQFELGLIQPNPYQPREREDPDHVRKIALSIANQGLLQTPVGRRVNGHIELAFGHTRLAAFRWLVDVQPTSNLAGDWSSMPVELRELSDLEMFEMAIRENIDRKDLTPVEQARAMRVYREQFGKTSAAIGELFGLSESAVRNKMRLADLPEPVQQQLAAGKLTEGQARDLLTVQRVAPVERVIETAQNVAAEPGAASRYISHALDNVNGVVKLWEHWRSGDPKAGDDLWPLNWTWDGQHYADWKVFRKFWKGPESDDLKEQYEQASRYIVDQRRNGKQVVGLTYIEQHPAREDVQEAVNHLFTPPACTACAFYARFEGSHYCGARVCWERKRETWAEMELQRLAKETGIAIYDPLHDSSVFEDADSWNRASVFNDWFASRKDFLRLRIKCQSNDHRLTDHALVQLISVGAESIQYVTKMQEAGKSKAAADRIRAEEDAARRRRREQTEQFLVQAAAPIFAQAFKGLKRGVLLALAEHVGYGSIDEKEDAAVVLAIRILGRMHAIRRDEGPAAAARHLQGVATSWGLELPGDWLDIAARFAIEES